MFLRPKACEVTLLGFVGVENLPFPAEFRCCSLEDRITLRNKEIPRKFRKLF